MAAWPHFNPENPKPIEHCQRAEPAQQADVERAEPDPHVQLVEQLARQRPWRHRLIRAWSRPSPRIVFSRAERRAELADTADGSAPLAGKDHWHNAYGFYLCDAFAPSLGDVSGGIHSHADGLIHIEPLTRQESGKDATLARFLDAADVEADDDSLQLPGGKEYVEGKTKCGDKDGVMQLKVNDEPPVTTGVTTRKMDEGDVVTIAFAPKGSEIPKPPSEAALRDQLAGDGTQMPGQVPDPLPTSTSAAPDQETTTSTTASP